jgi:hypothetical protein
MLAERVLLLEVAEALAVVAQARAVRHHHQLGRLRRLGDRDPGRPLGAGQLGGRVGQEERDGDDRESGHGDERQQVAIAHVAEEVGEDRGHVHVLEELHVPEVQVLEVLEVRTLRQAAHGVVPVVAAVGVAVGVAVAGAAGVAPAVRPWVGGVR